ncbi:MAG TPA: hypothetical protein DGD08_12475 [Gemmatimonas aurantiaca]|uniref:Uncharacterized protein n=2 Tax=Gemmatimonas aurantiaca TaxID=173480 RepID=C1ABV4_GEMAT|nr:hypothetical protein [Gemmatimonas aurantiaca]BAH39981.1 hypothetical protein GAU_2939 [Gemmatimonas aurantiaca T-27]HCT58011.1 hypothetical protein [Gemmatimonas aurantiaca]
MRATHIFAYLLVFGACTSSPDEPGTYRDTVEGLVVHGSFEWPVMADSAITLRMILKNPTSEGRRFEVPAGEPFSIQLLPTNDAAMIELPPDSYDRMARIVQIPARDSVIISRTVLEKNLRSLPNGVYRILGRVPNSSYVGVPLGVVSLPWGRSR